MLLNKTIAVVVPAYNEELQIGMVIESMPEFVDRIIIVNDCSTDRTNEVVKNYIENDNENYNNSKKIGSKQILKSKYNEAEIVLQENSTKEMKYYISSEIINQSPENDRIILIKNLVNGGVGASIARGYKWAKDNNIDCTAVMAGDGQMDPAELKSICDPVINENIDYVKGNRLMHKSAKYVIPKKRFIGNSVLSIMTKIASGYWRISDTQTGYTAISLSALKLIDIHKIYRSYGMPNDMLVKLNIASCSMREIEIKPIYRIGEQSKMRIGKVIPRITALLIRCFFRRLWFKYFIRDFHPLFLLYHLSFFLMLINIPFIIDIIDKVLTPHSLIVNNHLVISVFLFISSFQSFFFAMWMDIQDNDRLYK